MIRVLFVCLGNICRSPMAEAVFRYKVKESGLEQAIETDSAGTGDWHIGHPPHEGTRKILSQHHIDHSTLRARQVNEQDFSAFQYVIAMDSKNVQNLQSLNTQGHQPHVFKLLDFYPSNLSGDVPDPYFTGNFEEVYSMVDEACNQLLAYIREKEKL